MNKIYFIHVQTHNIYENDSIYYINSFLKKIKRTAILLIVENGNYQKNSFLSNYDNVEIFKIKGSNNYNEFSAFDEGKDYIYNNFSLNFNDIFIFSNDTFYRHRYFFGIMQRRFIVNFKIYENSSNFLIGYLDKSKLKNHYIEKIKFDSHISTFFFISNYNTLKDYNFVYFNNNNTILNINNKYLSINEVVNDYSTNIYNFLFKPSSTSWYKAINFEDIHKSSINYEKKIYSILNEHYLTIYIKKNKFFLISIFPAKKFNVINIYKSVEDRIILILKELNFFNYLK
jgi:hypothetical protein